jgi:hypothetical protein
MTHIAASKFAQEYDPNDGTGLLLIGAIGGRLGIEDGRNGLGRRRSELLLTGHCAQNPGREVNECNGDISPTGAK